MTADPLNGYGDRHAAQWWHWVAEHRLYVQLCVACGRTQHPPGPSCRHCHRRDQLDWSIHNGRGVLVSATRVVRTTSARMAGRAPYWLGLIDLSDGCHTLALLEGADPALITGGVTGTVGFTDVDDTTLLTFRPDPCTEAGDG